MVSFLFQDHSRSLLLNLPHLTVCCLPLRFGDQPHVILKERRLNLIFPQLIGAGFRDIGNLLALQNISKYRHSNIALVHIFLQQIAARISSL